jgi:hypothetical protein
VANPANWTAARGLGLASLTLALLLAAGTATASLGPLGGGAFPGALWSSVGSFSFHGCAAGKLEHPTFSASSGIGHGFVSATASSCPKSQGGFLSDTVGLSSVETIVTDPIVLTSADHGVNVSWNYSVRATDSLAHAVHLSCPATLTSTHYSVGAPYNYTYWDNSSSTYCYGAAVVQVDGGAYLTDVTTGAVYYAGGAWAGQSNTSGFTLDSSKSTQNYSGNRSYYAYNSTSSYNNDQFEGSSGVLAAPLLPDWWINGSFSSSDRYVVTTYVTLTAYVEIYDAPHVHGAATVDAKGGVDLVRLVTLAAF